MSIELEEGQTGKQVAVKTVSNLPLVSGEQYSHMGKYAGAAIMAAFEMIGGVQRLANWADQNPSDFYTKVMPKVVQRSSTVDVSGTVTIDDAITRLENQTQRGDIVDAQFDEMTYDL